jgi:pimeloyl-ACP methyl ester carboxylesterase
MINEDGFIERRILSNDGLSLYVRDYPGPKSGAKSPILCLGGLTRNSKDFAGLAKYWSRYRRVICPDKRGRGRSEYDPKWVNYNPQTYVEDVRHIMCALGVHDSVVVGTSLGGILGMAMGTALPGFIKALVMNDIGPEVRTDTLTDIIDYMKEPPVLSSWDEAGKHARAAFGSQIPLETDADWARAAKLSYIERADGKIVFDFDPNIVKPILKDDTKVHNLWHFWGATKRLPLLVVRGGKSVILDEAQLQKMHDSHPNMQSVTVDGVGHAPSMAEPEALGALNEFLEKY